MLQNGWILKDIMLNEISKSENDKRWYDSTYMKYLNYSNSYRQKVEYWLQ